MHDSRTARLTLPARPTARDWAVDAVALLVIDMQRDFLEPGGYAAALGNEVERARAAMPQVVRLLEAARASGLTIVHTREGHPADLSDCPPRKQQHGLEGMRIGDVGPLGRVLVQGEPGHDFVEEARAQEGELVLEKPGKGAFYATPLAEELAARGITALVICGVTTEVCVQSTVREAADRGLDCAVVEDACGSYHPELHEAALAMVRAQHGIFGATATTDDVCGALAIAAAADAVAVHSTQGVGQ